jgi:NTE family protein
VTSSGQPPKIGLALSGGGSRAIAFHLGAMRALDAEGLLDRIDVISAVSGGSVIAAMWAYSDDPFPQFEARVRDLLKRGLVRDIVIGLLHPKQLGYWIATLVVAHPVNAAALLLRGVLKGVTIPITWLGLSNQWTDRIQPPYCRWASRSTAFVIALKRRCFNSQRLSSERRHGVDIVINACELRTGTAFRFGTQSIGSWVLGRTDPSSVDIATAVAASAAFPLLLPALDLRLKLRQTSGSEPNQRVLLTDGGVFDNLGSSVLEPGRDPNISTNAFSLDYILCSSAGQGRPEERALPYWLLPRLIGTTMVMFRKLQDSGLAALHAQKRAGDLRGFALAYLAQEDPHISDRPDGFIARSSVIRYPTNFSAMSDSDSAMLIGRGEQIMRSVLRKHVPELISSS